MTEDVDMDMEKKEEVQCFLACRGRTCVAWIPENEAVVGNVISDKKIPYYGWVVKTTGSKRARQAS